MSNQWVPFYIGDYLRDTRGMSLAEHGAYLLLLMENWQGRPLPLDKNECVRIANASPEDAAKIDKILAKFFVEKRDGFWNKKAKEIFKKQQEKRLKAKDSADKRWNANAYANASKTHMLPEPDPELNLKPNGFRERGHKAPPNPPATGKNRGTRLSEDWAPSAALAEWAQNERPDLNISLESASFRDYWTAKAGQDGLKLNWDATFRNWIRRARGQNLGQTQSRASQLHTRLHGSDIVPAEQRQGGIIAL